MTLANISPTSDMYALFHLFARKAFFINATLWMGYTVQH